VGAALADEVSPVETSSSEGEALKVAALLYHDVVEEGRYETSGFQGAGPDRYKLEAAEFDEHLSVLAEHIGHPPAAVEESVEKIPACRGS